MKKLFLLALTLLMVSGFAFAGVSKNAEAYLTLNLAGATSVVNLGFVPAMEIESVDLDNITSQAFNGTEALSNLLIPLDTNTLTTQEAQFSIWYFINAVNKDGGVTLTLTVTPFTEIVEPPATPENMFGFILSKGEVKADGSTIPEMAPSYTIENNEDKTIDIFNNHGLTGLHRGYLTYKINSFNYSAIKALNYKSTLTLSVTAP